MENKKIFESIKKNLAHEDPKKVEVDIDNLYNHHLSKEFNLSKEDIKSNLFLVKSIIDDIEACNLSNNEECINKIGYHKHIIKMNEKLAVVAKECQKQMKYNEKYSYKNNFLFNSYKDQKISNVLITKQYFADKVDVSVKQVIDNFRKNLEEKEIKSLYLYGDFGIGKTYLSMAMANEISRKLNKNIIFLYTSDLVSRIKRGFNDQEANFKVNNLIDDMKNVDVLFLDDIGSEYASEWFYSDFLLNILNERLLANKPTFFNSNYSLDELESNIKIKIKNIENSKIIVGRLMDRIRSFVSNKSTKIKGINRRY